MDWQKYAGVVYIYIDGGQWYAFHFYFIVRQLSMCLNKVEYPYYLKYFENVVPNIWNFLG